MVEFNPDGSIKLPAKFLAMKEQNLDKMKNQRCLKITKEILSSRSPKKCLLRITLSDPIQDNRFIATIHDYFSQNSSVPSRLKKLDEKTFEIEIGTDFRRCTDCTTLIGRYREFLDGNVLEEKKGCTFSTINPSFCDEDYFE